MQIKKHKKILLVIPTLAGGGAERVMLNILKYLDREKFTPHLVLFAGRGEYLTQVSKDVNIYHLNKKNRFDFFKLIILLAFKIYPKIKPDIVISFLEYANLVVLISRKLSPIKPLIVISERNYTFLAQRYERMIKLRRLLVKKIYSQSDKIIAVSKGVAKDLAESFGVPHEKIQVIYNGVDLVFIKHLIREPFDNISPIRGNTPVIISCGRLTYQKDYPLLLESFTKTQSQIDSKLLILGQGEERASLGELANKLGIQDRVFFLGSQKNPFKYMAVSDIFVLSSRWEGFPNVILEAMACGIPVISARCPYGPDEIITDGINGILVPAGDKDAMADAIIRLLKDKALRELLVMGGNKRVKDFRVEKMVAEYEIMINSLP